MSHQQFHSNVTLSSSLQLHVYFILKARDLECLLDYSYQLSAV